jgi:glycosyltransferase involved in cell wall biosynthesis
MMLVVCGPGTARQSMVAAVHVALILHALGPGGTERQATYLVAGLVERGERVTVVEIRRADHFADAIREAGGEVVSAEARNRADIARVVRPIRALRADVVYGLNPEANVLAVASGAPALFGVRTSDLARLPKDAIAKVAMGLQHRLARRARFVVANSHVAARQLLARGYPFDRVRVVLNAVERQRFVASPADRRRRRAQLGVSEGEQLIATVARIEAQKDPETFLRAAEIAARPGRRFAWFGEGELRPALLSLAREAGVDLIAPGAVHDLASTYATIDVFTLTSAWAEGFSNAFAEALALGLPCVVTDTGDHGLAAGVATLVPPRSPEALAAAWDAAASNSAGPQWVRANLGVDQMVSSTHELLLEAARGA